MEIKIVIDNKELKSNYLKIKLILKEKKLNFIYENIFNFKISFIFIFYHQKLFLIFLKYFYFRY
jgi:hypothetical protein